MRILIADDDSTILEPLEIALKREGYEIRAAGDGLRAWELFQAERPDVAVLDVTMPGIDGLTLTRRIIESGPPRVPVILLSGRGSEHDRVAGLDLGADDYVLKPCSFRELAARIRAAARRVSSPTPLLTAGGLIMDPATHKFYVDGRPVDVTSHEFVLLVTLMERAGQVVRYASLMRAVWGCTVSNDLLRMAVYRLRQKVEPDPKKPRYIHTIPGVGFLLRPTGKATESGAQLP